MSTFEYNYHQTDPSKAARMASSPANKLVRRSTLGIAAAIALMTYGIKQTEKSTQFIKSLENTEQTVQGNIHNGSINPNSVVTLPAPVGGFPDSVAQAVATPSAEQEASDIISAQEGSDSVMSGSPITLPKGDVKPQFLPTPPTAK